MVTPDALFTLFGMSAHTYFCYYRFLLLLSLLLLLLLLFRYPSLAHLVLFVLYLCIPVLFPHLCMLFHTVFYFVVTIEHTFPIVFTHTRTRTHTNHIQTDTYFDFTNLSTTSPPPLLSSKPPRFKRQNRSIVYRLLFVLTFCFPIQTFEFSFPFPCVSVCFHRFFHRVSVFFFKISVFVCVCSVSARQRNENEPTLPFSPFCEIFRFRPKTVFKTIQISLFVDY